MQRIHPRIASLSRTLHHQIAHRGARAAVGTAAALLLATTLVACGTVKEMWRTEPEERLVIPQGATAYRCNAGKSFFIRSMDEGRAVWVMLIEREFRLEAPAAGATRFTNGRTALNLNGDQASLEEGSVTTYAACVRYQPGAKTEPVKAQPAKAAPAKGDSKGETKGETKGDTKGDTKGQPAESKPWWRVW